MKILHLLQSSVFSGAENVVCQIMKLFANDKDIQMVYVSPKGPIQESIESKGYTYVGLDCFSFGNIRKIIKEQHPDIVHAHDISASIFACICTIGTNIKVISHVHVNNADMAKLNIKTLLYYLSSFRYKHIFWVSPSCYNYYYFRNKLKRKSTVLCNVMDKSDIVERSQQVHTNKKYDLIYVGRIAYQKHPERLMSVIANVIKELPSVSVGIVGDGAMFEQTKKMATSMGLMNNVEFLGFQSNPLIYLVNSKVMIMTSRYEGLPMTVLESLALGVPVVSTPVDGLLDVIENDVNGYLSNYDNVIVQRVCEIISDNDLRRRLSHNAAQKFDMICDLDKYKSTINIVYRSK